MAFGVEDEHIIKLLLRNKHNGAEKLLIMLSSMNPSQTEETCLSFMPEVSLLIDLVVCSGPPETGSSHPQTLHHTDSWG